MSSFNVCILGIIVSILKMKKLRSERLDNTASQWWNEGLYTRLVTGHCCLRSSVGGEQYKDAKKPQNSQPGAPGIIETPCSPGLDLWMGSKLPHHFVGRGLEIRGSRTESQVCYDLPPGDCDKDVQWESIGRTQPSSWLSVPSAALLHLALCNLAPRPWNPG